MQEANVEVRDINKVREGGTHIVEIMKNAYMMMEGTTSTLQENETVNYYKVVTVDGEEQADMSASGRLGSEQTFDGVTSIYDGNGD